MAGIARQAKYTYWQLISRFGLPRSFGIVEKATVLITYFHPARLEHIESHVRNLLQCSFVEQIVLSNHNPDFRLEEHVALRDPRIVFLNQPMRRGCGYRWLVAQGINPQYLIVIDDDILLYPAQLAKLFKALLAAPEAPHGFSGMHVHGPEIFEYFEHEERAVDYLCEIYAVTSDHLQRYLALRETIATDPELMEMVDSAVDFMVISQSGQGKPHIHHGGKLLRCSTFKAEGVAVHKRNGFAQQMATIQRALQRAVAQH